MNLKDAIACTSQKDIEINKCSLVSFMENSKSSKMLKLHAKFKPSE